MFFKIKCYIISIIDNKKIKISIEDEDEYIKMNNNMQKLYKTKYVPTKEFNINIVKSKILINKIPYTTIQDLIGIEVYISGCSRYYKFEVDDIEKKIIQGYTLVANKITDDINNLV